MGEPVPKTVLLLHLRRQVLEHDADGYAQWRVREEQCTVDFATTAVVLCDVWDRHGCRGARERIDRLVPRVNGTVVAARAGGALIVHAPAGTLDFYAEHPARRRALVAPAVAPPPERPVDDPPLPYEPTRDCCDTLDWKRKNSPTRQHPGIGIDRERDVISDSGGEMLNVFAERGIRRMLILGFHTGHCILRRTFGIRQMVKWGVEIALVRDLTDALCNPALPPYVSQREGTRLMVEYIEKFWCPTLDSRDLADPANR